MTDDGEVKIGPFALGHVPGWAVAIVAITIGLTGAGVILWREVHQPQVQFVTMQQANDALEAQVEEYGRHLGETPEAAASLMDDARGKLNVGRYADGCLLITRTTSNGLRSKLVVDLARDAHSTPKNARAIVPALSEVAEAQGRCLWPHPGAPSTWYGQRSGCWVQVFHQWPDGCVMYQLFDACDGAWNPSIFWQRCIH